MKTACSGHECRIKRNKTCITCKSKPMEIRLFTIESNPKQIHFYFAFEEKRNEAYEKLTQSPPPSEGGPGGNRLRLNKSHIDIKIEDTKTLNDIIEL